MSSLSEPHAVTTDFVERGEVLQDPVVFLMQQVPKEGASGF